MSTDTHPDRLRWGADRLEEHHEYMATLARNLRDRRRLLARLKRARAGSEEFGPAEVAECDRIHEHWQKEFERLLSGKCDPNDLPESPETPDVADIRS